MREIQDGIPKFGEKYGFDLLEIFTLVRPYTFSGGPLTICYSPRPAAILYITLLF